MIRLKIDGMEVRIAEGATLLDAARAAGADMPTLCHLRETGALTSCMVCVVKDRATGRLLPSCAAKAIEGADVSTGCDEVVAARRAVLQMLLDEHVGDCEGPCARVCPASLNIPRMLRHVEAGEEAPAARRAKLDLIFPATLGHVCTAPCERVCRRGQYDTPVAIRHSHRDASMPFLDADLARDARRPATGKTVAVVGAGLAGMAAAWECALQGHACTVYEKRDRAGAALRALPAGKLPPEVLDAEIASVQALGVAFLLNREVGADVALDALLRENDAVILACGMGHDPHGRLFTAKEEPMHVRAVGAGKKAARAANACLAGLPAPPAEKPFNSAIGKLDTSELADYAVDRRKDAGQTPPPAGDETDSRGRLSQREAARCLHCDCGKPVTCKLRQYAQQYGLAPQITRIMDRPAVAPIRVSDGVQFEAGKCIKCGICVALVRASGLDAGMAFAGRGLDSHLRVPFDGPLAAGLGAVAEQCVRACPTAALSFRGAEET